VFEFLKKSNSKQELDRAKLRLAFTAALSAVLSFVAGLGDRHNENFMVTGSGRLLHVDYGYALGREPLDAMFIHYAVQGGRPAMTLQYDELYQALGPDLLQRVFWPVVGTAYTCIRRHSGRLAEMVYAVLLVDLPHDLRGDAQATMRAWGTAQAFVASRCVPAMSEASAWRFIHHQLWYSARHEWGQLIRDELRGLRLKQRTHQAMTHAYKVACTTGQNASAAFGVAAGATVSEKGPAFLRSSWEATTDATAAVRGATVGLLRRFSRAEAPVFERRPVQSSVVRNLFTGSSEEYGRAHDGEAYY
jgi:hypothetical protein